MEFVGIFINKLIPITFILPIYPHFQSGKSTVSSILYEYLKCPIIDADKVGHEVYEPGTDCYNSIIQHFGERVRGEDNKINRKELGSIIFSDPVKKKDLENIVWPEIRKQIINKIDIFKSSLADVIIFEAAVMIEAQWQDLADSVWITIIDPDIAIERLVKRNLISKEEAIKRLSSQLTNEQRLPYADVIIDTNKDLDILHQEVIQLYQSL